MKKLILICAVAFGMATSVHSQNISVEEPEFIGQTLYLTSDTTATSFQKEYGSISAKVKGSSFIPYAGAFAGGVNMYLTVKRPTSSNVIQASGEDIRLIVRVDNNNEDPAELIRVMTFEIKKSERRVRFMESSVVGGVKSNEAESYITYNAKKYGDSSYLITIPATALQQGGEYGIICSKIGAAGQTAQQALVTFSYK